MQAPDGEVRGIGEADVSSNAEESALSRWARLFAGQGGQTADEALRDEASREPTVDAGVATVAITPPDPVTITLAVFVPGTHPTRITVPDGEVEITGTVGGVEIEAASATLSGIPGPIVAELADGDSELHVEPAADASVSVTTGTGDVTRFAPAGLAYPVALEGPAHAKWTVGDLGLTVETDEAGRFKGLAGDGSVAVSVEAAGGVVTIKTY